MVRAQSLLPLLACLSLAALLEAQVPGDPGGFGPPGGGRGMPRNEKTEVVARFDADANGRLDADERAAAKAWLAENRPQRGRGGPGGRGFGGRRPPGFPGGEDEAPRTDRKAVTLSPKDVASYADRPLFDPDVVRTVFLDFEATDWSAELDAFYRTDVLVPATVTIDGRTYADVGVRFRGNTSYMMVRGRKKSFDLEFDFVHGKQDVQGVRNLDLVNCNHDASFLREALHGWISNRYLPAPRVALVRVVVNREDFGVYAAVQAFDKDFLADHFGSGKGDRFKVPPDFSGGGGLRWLGDDPAAYERNYELMSADDPRAWAGLVDLCAVLDSTPTEDLERILPQHLDVDAALWFLAVDNAVGDDDGYHSRASDYSLYRDPKGRFHPIARDNNEILLGARRGPGGRGGPGFGGPGFGGPGFGGPGFGGGPPGGDPRGDRPDRGPGGRGGPGRAAASPLEMAEREDRPLLRRLLEVPRWRARYLADLRELATTTLAPEAVGARIEAWRKALAPIVAVDANSATDLAAFERELATGDADQPAAGSLLAVIAQRRRAILDDDAMQGAWPRLTELEATYAMNRDGEPALHVRCRAGGAEILRVDLHHDRGPFGAYDTTPMYDDGRHGDGGVGDGVYGGYLPKAEKGDTWRFWVEATAAGSGHVACLPAGGGARPERWQAPKD